MKRLKIVFVGLIAFFSFTCVRTLSDGVNMYRLYNHNSGEHFYTKDNYEMEFLVRAGWYYEGIGWIAATEGNPVYRLYNPNSGGHHYTLNGFEKDNLVAQGWRYEGVGWYSGGTVALHRNYNPAATIGTHNYTTNKHESNALTSQKWRYEGIAWYGLDSGHGQPVSFNTVNLSKPVYFSQRDGKWAKEKFNDSTMYYNGCVPTSIAMILMGSYRMNLGPVQVAHRMNPISMENFGVTSEDLINTVKTFGKTVEVVATKERADYLLAQGYPLIYFLQVPGGGHGVVAFGYSNGVTEILDPLDRKVFNGWYSTDYLWKIPIRDKSGWLSGRPVFCIR